MVTHGLEVALIAHGPRPSLRRGQGVMGVCVSKTQIRPVLGTEVPSETTRKSPFEDELSRNVRFPATLAAADPNSTVHVLPATEELSRSFESERKLLHLKLEEMHLKIESLEAVISRLTQSLNSPLCPDADFSKIDFNEEREDEEKIKSFFEMLVKGRGKLDMKGVENARTELKNHYLNNANACEEWDRLAQVLETEIECSLGGQGIDLDKFSQILMTEIPKLPGRVHWACSLGLGNVLAKYLKPGGVFDGQRGIKEMTETEISAASAAFVRQAPAVIIAAWKALRDGKYPNAEDANSKFAMTDGAFAGRFATLDDFYRGVEYRLGQPNPKLYEGLRNEHCARPNAGTWFLAPNYGLCSKARWEWQWTVGAEEATQADLRERLSAHEGKYPGEIGDRLSQTLIRVVVTAVRPTSVVSGAFETSPVISAMIENLNRELKVKLESEALGLLEADEERLRGVTIAEKAKICDSGVEIKLMLPFAVPALTASKIEILTNAVSCTCGVDSACVAINEVVERTWEYCRFTSEARLRAGIEKLTLDELPSVVKKVAEELCICAERASACVSAAEVALRSARSNEVTVLECCKAIDGEADALQKIIEILVDSFCEQTREWAARQQHRKQGRSREGTVQALMIRGNVEPVVTKARLRSEEFTVLRLYTGPLYIIYNAVMRDFPRDIVNSLAGNKFETTVFVIVSGITKLAKVTPVPPRRLLYRGLGGMLLPEQFWKKTAQGFLGGVELGLMSTTTERSVAIQYSGHEKKRAMMLEIQAGRIDIGATLGFLSQYANEEEFLMQPLSCLEVPFPHHSARAL